MGGGGTEYDTLTIGDKSLEPMGTMLFATQQSLQKQLAMLDTVNQRNYNRNGSREEGSGSPMRKARQKYGVGSTGGSRKV